MEKLACVLTGWLKVSDERLEFNKTKPKCLAACVMLGIFGLVLAGCAVVSRTSSPALSDVTISDLRCEYRVAPLGIDIAVPRLSWIVQSPSRGQLQTACQILVASSPEKLARDEADLWDSGKVALNQANQVEYSGRPLKSQMRCFWKVRVWDKSGKVSLWSNPAFWTMGLLNRYDWQAQWVGFDEPLKSAVTSEVGYIKKFKVNLPRPRYLRKSFVTAKPVACAKVYASALGLYELHINGARVGEDCLTPGWTDYDKRVYYNTYDVTNLLLQGDNAVGAILADGWFSGLLGWAPKRNNYGDKTRFLAQMYIEYADGTSETLFTDDSWKANTGPMQEADIYMGEVYDATAGLPGWDTAGFDDTSWKPVDVTREISAKLLAYPGVNVKQFAEIAPVNITEPNQGVFVFDMGKNFAGFAKLKVKGNYGDRITLRFAERLNSDGTVYLTNLRGARAVDTYICKGDGVEIWQPKFTFHGFQYVEVTGLSDKPGPDTVTGIAISSDTPLVGSFQCSDEVANKLYSNIVTTQQSNFIDIPTDCPQRDERLGWTGDAQVFIRAATYNTDVSAFFTKWLVDLEDAQSAAGAFPKVAPRKYNLDDGPAAWGDAGTVCPWTIYQVYGDKRLLEKHYPAMTKWVEFSKKHSKDLIRPSTGYGDWLNIKADTRKDLLATAYFAYSTKLTAQAAQVLGKSADARRYNKLFRQIKLAFNKKFVAEDGKIASDTQTAYVLALAFDLLPKDKRQIAAKRLMDNIEKRNWHLSTGFIGTKDLMTTLTEVGRTDVAYKLFQQDSFPSWGFSVKNGATSIWERWDGWTPDRGFQDPNMNSFAHYSFGAVAEWMFKTIAGIDTDGAGYSKIIIRPRPGGSLTWAGGSYKSINGLIATYWKIEQGRISLDVTIPANTTATVYVPTIDSHSVTESGKAPAGNAPGVRFLKPRPDCAVFKLGSGSYKFQAKFAEQP
jgi:alpha-L-rhamnosidase